MKITLNSTLILLIFFSSVTLIKRLFSLNSTLILLIYQPAADSRQTISCFKFHFDSINMKKVIIGIISHLSLNSTLILLICERFKSVSFVQDDFKFHFDSINIVSDIVTDALTGFFKFHFDSINIKRLRRYLCR